ncbi:F-box/kelch-repeat protein At3g23880-like [Papaver somniferum]|uniref:F-box/kelch-repeat protein At3g23880-like n=1 Tax=Papaver somniferum TaxID=3469 RepID=UPI000E6F689E|nr:F-box/kelch-repeat protein At3g23880-like [Papaver somniferum]
MVRATPTCNLKNNNINKFPLVQPQENQNLLQIPSQVKENDKFDQQNSISDDGIQHVESLEESFGNLQIGEDYFSKLLYDVKLQILIRVPTESLLDCKLVCKSWNSIIHSGSFSRFHLHNLIKSDSGKFGFLAYSGYAFNYGEYDDNESTSTQRKLDLRPPFNNGIVVGSCNGLICLCKNPSLYICNPVIRERNLLPEIRKPYIDADQHLDWISGFGYVSSTDEYKVLGIHVLQNEFLVIHIYTLGRDTGWRNIGKFSADLRPYTWKESAVFANGALYWIGGCVEKVFSFDLDKECFHTHLSPPELPENNDWSFNRLLVLEGCLYFAAWFFDECEGNEFYDIWRLEKKARKCQQDWSWKYIFTVQQNTLLAITKGGKVLTQIDGDIYLYNPISSTSKRVVKFEELNSDICPHKNTLISFKDLGEEDPETIQSKMVSDEQPEDVGALGNVNNS